MKKHLVYFLSFAMIGALLMGCKHEKQINVASLSIENDDQNEKDTTIYGRCADAAMHTFSLVDAKGDTIDYIIDDAEGVVQGGLYQNDKMAVIEETVDGEQYATKVINITSLMGRWASLDKNFELKDGGVVESHREKESKTYTSWKIFNGKLILAPDTFDINMLGVDSLYLENKDGIFFFTRQIESRK